jgi:hypothetical protein
MSARGCSFSTVDIAYEWGGVGRFKVYNAFRLGRHHSRIAMQFLVQSFCRSVVLVASSNNNRQHQSNLLSRFVKVIHGHKSQELKR